MKLYPAQRSVKITLESMLKDYRGVILEGEMGTGKTWIAAEMASKYNKTLYIGEAKALKDVQKKIHQYEQLFNNIVDIDFISYHGFKDLNKISAKEIQKYDLFIWDECHNLRNYKAGWTKRYVRLNRGKHLHLSGTPMIKSPLDYVYVFRKCDVVPSTEYYYRTFFGAEQSNFFNGLDKSGPFQNKEAWMTMRDKVRVSLKLKEIDNSLPSINFNIVKLEGEYSPPKDITKETKTRLAAGLKKVDGAVTHISEELISKSIDKSLILCYFHDTAKKVAENFGVKPALTQKDVANAMEKLKEDGGIMVTTLGLTSSSLDLNECDNVYLIESTYSYALDMQSICRCRRIGKKNDLNVTYFSLSGEHSVAKSFSRQYLLEGMERSKLSPSQLARLEICPGSYWLPVTGETPEYIKAAANKGTINHGVVERYLRNSKVPICAEVPREVRNMINFCRERISEAKNYGIEGQVNLFPVHEALVGTCDFFSFDGTNLYVIDYKNGRGQVNVENNLQLIAYSLMILHTYQIDVPGEIIHIIYQRSKKKACTYPAKVVQSWEQRVRRIVTKIQEAEKEPLKHINKDPKCDFFCTARKYHQQQEEDEMAKQYTVDDRKYPRVSLTGKAFFVDRKPVTTKAGRSFTALNIGLGFDSITEELKNLFPEGSKEQKLLQQTVKYDADRKSFKVYVKGLTESISGETAINQFDELTTECRVKIVETDTWSGINFDIVKIKLVKAQEQTDAPKEESRETEEQVLLNAWAT